MGKAEYKVKGGKLVKIQLAQRSTRIEKIKITGDFFLHPETLIETLEKALKGRLLHEQDLTEFIDSLLKREKAALLGVAPKDIAKCIMMAGQKNE